MLLRICLGLLLNANWSIVSDMTLYIVIPTRRSIASATQILVILRIRKSVKVNLLQ